MKKIIPFLPATLYYAFIFYVSSRTVELPFDFPGRYGDKALHILEFSVLGWLLAFGFHGILKFSARLRHASAFFVVTALGVLDEVHQSFVPGRHAEIGDAIADAAGVAIGILFFGITCRILAEFHRRRNRPSGRSKSPACKQRDSKPSG